MTPYTSFLADENTQLTDRGRIRREAGQRLDDLSVASGRGGFDQRRFKKSLQSASQFSGAEGSFGVFESGPGGSGAGVRPGYGVSTGGLPSPVKPGKADSPANASEKSSAPTRRVRRIGAKTFYWKKNSWKDSELSDEKTKSLKVIEIEQYSAEYFALAARDKGKWSKFLTLKEPVEVLLGESRYRIVPPKQKASVGESKEASNPAKKSRRRE